LILFLFQFIACQDSPNISKWPNTFYSWMKTTITLPGKPPHYDVGQLIVFDETNHFACRYNQQNLVKPSKQRPIDYCSNKSHFSLGDIPVNNNTCVGNKPYVFTKPDWPLEFVEESRFLGVEIISGKKCNHFYHSYIELNGRVTQIDAWTEVGKQVGGICQFVLSDTETREVRTFAFDGFQIGYPREALQCTSAKIACSEEDWVCKIKKDIPQNKIQSALNWVCGSGGINCAPINKGGEFYFPNTLLAHANWAVNAYYQKNKDFGVGSCDFGGIAELGPPSKRMQSYKKRGKLFSGLGNNNLIC